MCHNFGRFLQQGLRNSEVLEQFSRQRKPGRGCQQFSLSVSGNLKLLEEERPDRRTSNIRLDQRYAKQTTRASQTPTKHGLTPSWHEACGRSGTGTESVSSVRIRLEQRCARATTRASQTPTNHGLTPSWHESSGRIGTETESISDARVADQHRYADQQRYGRA